MAPGWLMALHTGTAAIQSTIKIKRVNMYIGKKKSLPWLTGQHIPFYHDNLLPFQFYYSKGHPNCLPYQNL